MGTFELIEESPMAGRRHPVENGAIVGREGCDVVLPDPEISRRHAALHLLSEGPAVEDLGSTNGVWVNGHRITGVQRLAGGDSVRFGNTVLRVATTSGPTRLSSVVDEPGATPPEAPWVQQEPPASVPPSAAPQPVATPQPIEAPPQPARAPAGARGDVPAPPERMPTALRNVLPQVPPAPALFEPPPRTRRGGSAARRVEATAVSYGVVTATAILVIAYLAQR